MARPFRNSSQRRRRAIESGDDSRFDKPDLFGGMVTFQLRRLEPLVAWAVAGYTYGSQRCWASVAPPTGRLPCSPPVSRAGAGCFRHGCMAPCCCVLCCCWPGSCCCFWCRVPAAPPAPIFLDCRGCDFLFAAVASPLGDCGDRASRGRVWPCLLAGATGDGMVRGFTAWIFYAPGFDLGIVFGRSMRQSDQRAEAPMRDVRTRLYNARGFFVHGTVLSGSATGKGSRFRWPCSAAPTWRIFAAFWVKRYSRLVHPAGEKICAVPGQGIAALMSHWSLRYCCRGTRIKPPDC